MTAAFLTRPDAGPDLQRRARGCASHDLREAGARRPAQPSDAVRLAVAGITLPSRQDRAWSRRSRSTRSWAVD